MSWLDHAREVLDHVERQSDAIEQASQVCAGVIGAGDLVHCFGTGHSRIPVEEMFPRYGSYPGFSPVVELSLTYYTPVTGPNGLRQAMFLERQSGLAEIVLASLAPRAGDAVIVFSASGRNAVPIEMAMGARDRGLPVIAVTSLQQSGALPPSHPTRTVLADHADVVLDIGSPASDAVCEIPGLETPVGPLSTLGYVCVVNALKVRTAELLVERGSMPPVITHASRVGEERSAQSIADSLAEHDRRTRRPE